MARLNVRGIVCLLAVLAVTHSSAGYASDWNVDNLGESSGVDRTSSRDQVGLVDSAPLQGEASMRANIQEQIKNISNTATTQASLPNFIPFTASMTDMDQLGYMKAGYQPGELNGEIGWSNIPGTFTAAYATVGGAPAASKDNSAH